MGARHRRRDGQERAARAVRGADGRARQRRQRAARGVAVASQRRPLWVIFATAFCVNLRFVIYSAPWAKYFGHMPRRQRLTLGYFAGDLNYVLFLRRFPEPRPAPEQLPYLWGSVVWGWSSWMGASLLGIFLADRVPTEWGLGFAGVLALLGIAYSLLSGTKGWVASAVAACAPW
jgi:predicted branched-subunit amino acid permease